MSSLKTNFALCATDVSCQTNISLAQFHPPSQRFFNAWMVAWVEVAGALASVQWKSRCEGVTERVSRRVDGAVGPSPLPGGRYAHE